MFFFIFVRYKKAYPLNDNTNDESYRKIFEFENQKIKFEFLDKSAYEDKTPPINYLKIADGFVVVFSINKLESFKYVENFIEESLVKNNFEKKPFVIVGSKRDLENERQVTKTEASSLAEKWNTKYFETQMKDLSNVDDPFLEVIRLIKLTRELNKVVEKPLEKEKKCIIN